MLVPGPSGSSVWKTRTNQGRCRETRQPSRGASQECEHDACHGPKAQPGFTFPKLEGGRPRVATFAKFKI